MQAVRNSVTIREERKTAGKESLARLSADDSGKFKRFIQAAGVELDPALAMGILEHMFFVEHKSALP